MCFAKHNSIKGITLVELMISLFISTLILSSVITIYLAMQSIHQEQAALINIIENSHAAFNFIKSDINHIHAYFIEKTRRKNDRGDPIYALYRIDENQHKIELVEGVNAMKIQYTVLDNNKIIEINESKINKNEKIMGVNIELTFVSIHAPYLQKKEYMYVSI